MWCGCARSCARREGAFLSAGRIDRQYAERHWKGLKAEGGGGWHEKKGKASKGRGGGGGGGGGGGKKKKNPPPPLLRAIMEKRTHQDANGLCRVDGCALQSLDNAGPGEVAEVLDARHVVHSSARKSVGAGNDCTDALHINLGKGREMCISVCVRECVCAL